MKLFRLNAVKDAAKDMAEAMELLTLDLNELKKRYLNGHHDIQAQSGIDVGIDNLRKPNGTRDRSR